MASKLRKAGIGAFLGILIGFFSLAVVALILYSISSTSKEYDTVRAEKRSEKLQELKKQDQAELENVGWVDQGKKIAHIPIKDAMLIAANKLKNKPVVVSSVPVPTPVSLAVPPADSTTAPAAETPAPAAATPTPAPAP